MPCLLIHAGALSCALAFVVSVTLGLHLTFVQGNGLFCGVIVGLGLGLCSAPLRRIVRLSLVLILLGLSAALVLPAHAKGAPQFDTIEQALAATSALRAKPAASLAAPIPTLPAAAPVVVSVERAPSAETSIAVPLNEWAALARNTVVTVLLALWGCARNKLPAPVLWAIKLYGERRLIEQAVDLAINAVPGASKGAPLTIDLGNRVHAYAVQWIIDTVPGLVVTMMGGEAGIRAKIFAALHLEPDADAAALGVAAAG